MSPGDRPHWEELDHTADIGIRAFGAGIEEIFAHAAEGMFRIIAGERTIRPLEETLVRIQGRPEDEVHPERLLARFLSELLFLCETRRILFCKFEIERDEEGLKIICHGERIGPDRSGLGMEIKAVTWYGLDLDTQKGMAQVIFDV